MRTVLYFCCVVFSQTSAYISYSEFSKLKQSICMYVIMLFVCFINSWSCYLMYQKYPQVLSVDLSNQTNKKLSSVSPHLFDKAVFCHLQKDNLLSCSVYYVLFSSDLSHNLPAIKDSLYAIGSKWDSWWELFDVNTYKQLRCKWKPVQQTGETESLNRKRSDGTITIRNEINIYYLDTYFQMVNGFNVWAVCLVWSCRWEKSRVKLPVVGYEKPEQRRSSPGTSITRDKYHQGQVSSGTGIIRDRYHQGQVSSGTSITRDKYHQGQVSPGTSITRDKYHQGQVSPGTSITRDKYHQGQVSPGTSITRDKYHQGQVSPGTSITRDKYHQGQVSPGTSITRDKYHQGQVSSGTSITRDKYHQGQVSPGTSITRDRYHQGQVSSGKRIISGQNYRNLERWYEIFHTFLPWILMKKMWSSRQVLPFTAR